MAVWERCLHPAEIAAISGLGRLAGAALDEPALSQVLKLQPGAPGVVLGGEIWRCVLNPPPPPGGTPAQAGQCYSDADGFKYILLTRHGDVTVSLSTSKHTGTSLHLR